MDKVNNWVWSEYAEELKPDRKAGTSVPVEYLMKGDKEYFPYSEWIKMGFVKKKNSDQKKETE